MYTFGSACLVPRVPPLHNWNGPQLALFLSLSPASIHTQTFAPAFPYIFSSHLSISFSFFVSFSKLFAPIVFPHSLLLLATSKFWHSKFLHQPLRELPDYLKCNRTYQIYYLACHPHTHTHLNSSTPNTTNSANPNPIRPPNRHRSASAGNTATEPDHAEDPPALPGATAASGP